MNLGVAGSCDSLTIPKLYRVLGHPATMPEVGRPLTPFA